MPEGNDSGAQAGAEQQQGQQGQTGGQQGGQAPPWEASGEPFDPDRAWRRIQALQGERDTLRSRVTEHEQASMTELQRITQRAEQAEGQLPTLQQENARLRVALEVGLDADLMDRLRGNTVEELKADAEQLKGRFGARQQPFDHGARQSAGPQSMNDLIFGARQR
jgi:hypothetical protein